MEVGLLRQRFAQIDPKLRIKVIYADDDIVVIHKPTRLRAVPGNAPKAVDGPNQDENDTAQQERPDMNASQAWQEAIRRIRQRQADLIEEYIAKLAPSDRQAQIPRRMAKFRSFVNRNQRRFFVGNETVSGRIDPTVTTAMFERIDEEAQVLAHKPPSTPHESSACGQLILLGYAKGTRSSADLFVVHRLDCDTSGVMVLARTHEAAARLGQAWRQQGEVHKTYQARVTNDWTLSGTSGRIDLPLSSVPDSITWCVDTRDGKPSTTLWNVIDQQADYTMLELVPVTGRTHQLRIHCAAHGGGILGDRLYGTVEAERLYLHACRLRFPHPKSSQKMEFTIDPDW